MKTLTSKLGIGFALLIVALCSRQQALAYDVEEHHNRKTGDITVIVITGHNETFNTLVRDILDASGLFLNEDQIQQVKDTIQKGNTLKADTDGILAPKQRLDLSAAVQLALVFNQLNDSGVRIIAKLRLDNTNGKSAEVRFINIRNASTLDIPDDSLGVSAASANYIFMIVSAFPDAVKRYKTSFNVFEGRSGWRRIYSGKSEDYLAERVIVDVLYHEDVHILTKSAIDSPEFSKRFWDDPVLSACAGYKRRNTIEGEVAAYVGEISYSEEPLLILETLFRWAEDIRSEPGQVPQEYSDTGQVIKVLLADKLKYLDSLINREEEDHRNGNPQGLSQKQKEGIRKEVMKRYKQGDYFSIKAAPGGVRSKWVEFLNSFSNDKLREAAVDIYRNKYPGMPLPDISSIHLPESVLAEYREMTKKH